MSKNQFNGANAMLKHTGSGAGRQAIKPSALVLTNHQASEITAKYTKRIKYVTQLHEANMR